MTMDIEFTLIILSVLFVLIGLAGLVLPMLPGTPVVYVGLILAAWAEDFQYVGLWTLAALGVLTIITYFIDFAATAFGAKRFGATPRAAAGAAIGLVIGFFGGLVGLILGPFIGAVIGELSGRRTLGAASQAGFGATMGLLIGGAIKIALTFIMLGVFLFVRWVNLSP
jgi:uncharacterized protein YqgC (DUF456 family)